VLLRREDLRSHKSICQRMSYGGGIFLVLLARSSLAFLQHRTRSLTHGETLHHRTSSSRTVAASAASRRVVTYSSSSSPPPFGPSDDAWDDLEALQDELVLAEAIEQRNEAQLPSFIDAQAQWEAQDESDRWILTRKPLVEARIDQLLVAAQKEQPPPSPPSPPPPPSSSSSSGSTLASVSGVLLAASLSSSLAVFCGADAASAVGDDILLGVGGTVAVQQKQAAVFLLLPLWAYKASAIANGQKLMLSLDVTIAIATLAALKTIIS
jgi:hypothetical protein